jgi:hypothetical protein
VDLGSPGGGGQHETETHGADSGDCGAKDEQGMTLANELSELLRALRGELAGRVLACFPDDEIAALLLLDHVVYTI